MFTMISRLVAHKGVDLLRECAARFIDSHDAQFVLLGTGDPEYEAFFRGLEERHRDKVRCCIMFDRALSHRVYAAGDILLMPSKSEPCGLSQMIACRYGNVPLVRATGGLNDSIHDCSLGSGNGFVFDSYDTASFEFVLNNAYSHWLDRENWEKLVKYDLKEDFNRSRAAGEYVEMYKEMI
jgi:starch synthase